MSAEPSNSTKILFITLYILDLFIFQIEKVNIRLKKY